MAGPFLATVVYRQCRNCFLSVPNDWITGRSESLVLVFEVHYNVSQRAVLSWSGEVTQRSGFLGTQSTIEINGFYALKLGMEEGSQVIVNIKKDVKRLECLAAEPVAIDDWEILELNANYIQNNLMNQVRVVWDGQVLPIWVNQSICILVKIGSLEPSRSYGVLEQNTEVRIIPKTRDSNREAGSDAAAAANADGDRPPILPDTDHPIISDHDLMEKTNRDSSDGNDTGDAKGWSLTGYVRNAIGFFTAEDKSDTILGSNGVGATPSFITDDCGQPSSNNPVNYAACTLRLHPVDMTDLVRGLDPVGVVPGIQSMGGVNLASLLAQHTTAFVLSASLVDRRGIGDATQRVPFVMARLSKCVPPFESPVSSKSSDSGDDKNSPKSATTGTPIKRDKQAEKTSKSKDSGTALKQPHCFVMVVIVDHVADFLHRDGDVDALSKLRRRLMPGVVLVQDAVRRQLTCETAHPVKLNFDIGSTARPSSVHLHLNQNEMPDNLPHLTTESLLRRSFAKMCSADSPLLIANNTLIEISSYEGQRLDFVLTTSEKDKSRHTGETPLLITSHCKINVHLKTSNKGIVIVSNASDLDLPVVGLKSAALGGVDNVLRECLTSLKLALSLGPLAQCLCRPSLVTSGGLILCGSAGSGKTALASSLCRELSAAPYFVFPSVVSCKNLKGKRVETISKRWKRVYLEAQFRAPSIVILDDLDQVISAPSGPENEIGSVAVYHTKLADSLREILKSVKMSHNARVVTIVTCPNPMAIHKTLSAPQGVHLFPNIVQLEAPNLEQREDIIKHLILSKTFLSSDSLTAIDWRPLAAKLEGFVARDLEMIVDRASHCATSRCSNKDCESGEELLLTNEDFEGALENFVPIALRGLQLHVPGKLGWQDVGGLEQVKKTLVETLQWPAKYPELFSKCPLAMRSGVLLYGAPGTGKTLLANVVAKECDMSFISIKGPELLSKYIGASEQSVRDLFERASNAKPCVIFFDEFDSLAPRRGHDSTGVTDRVVNQLLTQMDGVEGRKGVYVLAATSRPDLIDPALLRPGRLDKCLYCPLPSKEDRCAILKALSRPMTLSDDVDLDSLADACDFFSGADLQGLLYNAQLGAIHRTLDAKSRRRLSTESGSPEVRDLSQGSADMGSFDIVDCNNGDTIVRSSTRTSNRSGDRGERSFTHVPNLEEGIVTLDADVNDVISKQIDNIASNLNGWPETFIDDSVNDSPRPSVVVTLNDLMTAVSDMKPSVGEADRQRYDAIYQMFIKSRGGGYFDSSINTSGKRATLA